MKRHRALKSILLGISLFAAGVVPIGITRAATATAGDPPRLAFVDGFELRVVAIDGSDDRTLAWSGAPLAPPVGWEGLRTPTWSPDGRRVAFSRSSAVGWLAPRTELRIVDAEGRNDTTALSLPGAGTIEELHWSPTADRLAFVLFTPNPAGIVTWGAGSRWDVYVVNSDGSGLRLIAPLHASHARGLDWSPDGTRLIYSSDELGVPGVYTINVDGLPLTKRLTPPLLIAHDPRWSPDGLRIAFLGSNVLPASEVLSADTRLWTVAPDGRELRALPATTGEPPSWSPDSRWLAYSACETYSCGIKAISADGLSERTLTTGLEDAADHGPIWSRHGTIAFTRHTQSCCTQSLWVMNGDGSGVRRLTNAESVSFDLAWSR